MENDKDVLRLKRLLKKFDEWEKKANLTPEEKKTAEERLRLEDLYIEKFSDNIFAAFHNSDATDEEICRDLRKCLETNTDWWTLHGEVYQDDVDY